MPSLVFGHIGDRNVSKAVATGWLVNSIWREQFDGAILRSDILELADLKKGDELSGTVRNVVDFGAFVDIGLQ